MPLNPDRISAIIVDDEAPARRELRRLLAVHEDVHVVGEAGDVPVANHPEVRARDGEHLAPVGRPAAAPQIAEQVEHHRR